MTRQDVYQNVIISITQSLADGVKPWQCSWDSNFSTQWPINATTSKEYQGVNAAILLIAQSAFQLSSNQWLTHRQSMEWLESESRQRGLNLVRVTRQRGNSYYLATKEGDYVGIRKGAKAIPCVKWQPPVYGHPISDGNDRSQDKVMLKRGFSKSFKVFNIDQIVGIKEHYKPIDPDYAKAQSVILTAAEKIGLTIISEGNRAYFSRKDEIIVLPDREKFESEGAYFATLLHELVHASILKLERKMPDDATEAQALEELVAEIGALFLCSKLGIDGEHIDNHSAYIAGWSKMLTNDPEAFARASKYAQQATECILELGEANLAR